MRAGRRALALSSLTCVLASALCGVAAAAPVDLDTSFGGDGIGNRVR
jgi:hypothetical protein